MNRRPNPNMCSINDDMYAPLSSLKEAREYLQQEKEFYEMTGATCDYQKAKDEVIDFLTSAGIL